MPLHPEVEAHAAQMRELMPLALSDLAITDLRAAIDAGMVASAIEVAEVTDHVVLGRGGPIPIRVYRPDVDGDLPVLLWLHGGGFALGELSIGDDMCRRLANQVGAVVVNVAYRLAPEHPYPAGFEDSLDVYQWILDKPTELGDADATRVAVAGDSAGGNLTMALALWVRDNNVAAPRCQVSVYGTADMQVNDLDMGDLPFLTAKDAHWFWDMYVPDESVRTDPYVNPARATDLTNLSPLLVITAEYDPTSTATEEYGYAVANAGGEAVVNRYAGVHHGFFSQPDVFSTARAALDETVAFLRRHLQ